ncbi:MAG: hypothetical protein HY587_02040 [Candidatus Omnitrophica bacterium]|nr:hypothetical protein [Candidatus Omnitrophota bacterium]
MIDREIKARFEEFSLSGIKPQDSSVVIPTVSGTRFSRYGTHAYYFLNFKTQKATCVKIRHRDIIFPGLKKLAKANYKQHQFLSRPRLLFQSYHYGFNFLEQIMLMTVPHTVTEIGIGKFIISLWSYFGYLVIDLKQKTVVYRMMDENDENHIFGSKQWHEADSDSLYYMTYSLKDSLKKVSDPTEKVFSRILKQVILTSDMKEVWSGYFADYMHDILISKNARYLVACELGRFTDKNKNLIPSKALILDMQSKREWIVSVVANAAHAQFDPDDPETVYFSNHNFQFVHTPLLDLFKKGAYSLKFLGPASVHKFRLTPEGPKEMGAFNEPDLFRLTNFHVFKHHGQKILAAMGAPNFIFIADAEHMRLIKKIEVKNPYPASYIGTFTPSLDGEKLYIQTTRAFQILDLTSGKPDFIRNYDFNHTCSNHMMASRNIDW